MSTDATIVHPTTGELLDHLDTQPPEILADALYELRQRTTRMCEMERALEDELRRRIGTRQRAVLIFGAYEVAARSRSRSDWDADELEGVLRDLLEQGAVQAGEVTEVIRHPTVVSASEAQRLLSRLTGDARTAVERCRSWVPSGKPKVEVARSVSLIPEESQP